MNIEDTKQWYFFLFSHLYLYTFPFVLGTYS